MLKKPTQGHCLGDAVSLIPWGWDIGPTSPMGPSPWPSWNARPMGISTKGDLYTYIHTHRKNISPKFCDHKESHEIENEKCFFRFFLYYFSVSSSPENPTQTHSQELRQNFNFPLHAKKL